MGVSKEVLKMPKGIAPLETLTSLHQALAENLLTAIKTPLSPEGEPLAVATPAILNVARQFLKDNKIEAIPVVDSPIGLLSTLPVFTLDEQAEVDLSLMKQDLKLN